MTLLSTPCRRLGKAFVKLLVEEAIDMQTTSAYTLCKVSAQNLVTKLSTFHDRNRTEWGMSKDQYCTQFIEGMLLEKLCDKTTDDNESDKMGKGGLFSSAKTRFRRHWDKEILSGIEFSSEDARDTIESIAREFVSLLARKRSLEFLQYLRG